MTWQAVSRILRVCFARSRPTGIRTLRPAQGVLASAERRFDNTLYARGGGDRDTGRPVAAGGALPHRPGTAVAGARSARRLDPSRVAGQDLPEAGGPEALPAAGIRPVAGKAGPA